MPTGPKRRLVMSFKFKKKGNGTQWSVNICNDWFPDGHNVGARQTLTPPIVRKDRPGSKPAGPSVRSGEAVSAAAPPPPLATGPLAHSRSPKPVWSKNHAPFPTAFCRARALRPSHSKTSRAFWRMHSATFAWRPSIGRGEHDRSSSPFRHRNSRGPVSVFMSAAASGCRTPSRMPYSTSQDFVYR